MGANVVNIANNTIQVAHKNLQGTTDPNIGDLNNYFLFVSFLIFVVIAFVFIQNFSKE